MTPLIGFAGAPYTLASYLVEGGPSKEQLKTRALMHSEPETWAALLTWCAEITGAFLAAQIEAGASAGQLFDSWAGSLSLRDYTERVAPFSARALEPVRELLQLLDDAAFQVKDVGKTFMQEICAGFFATYPSRTVHDDVLFPVIRQHAGGHRQLFSESIRRHFNSLVKMPYLVLIVVPHIDNDGVRSFRQAVELFGIHISPFFAHVKSRVFDAVCHDLIPHLYLQYPEGSAVIVHGYVETQPFQTGKAPEPGRETFKITLRHADLGIDAFRGNVDTAKDLFLPEGYI